MGGSTVKNGPGLSCRRRRALERVRPRPPETPAAAGAPRELRKSGFLKVEARSAVAVVSIVAAA